ncbi:MAG: hypothetical protein ACJAX9_002711 [Celeribacter sp.]|jgi:hypothetical protein
MNTTKIRSFAALTICNTLLATALCADPLEDVLYTCTHLADDTNARVEVLQTRDWTKVKNFNEAALALAHANAFAHRPTENTQEAWANLFSQEKEKDAHLDWPHAFEKHGHFVFLDDIAPEDFTNYATCAYILKGGGRSADLFTEAEALGTLRSDRGTYQGRISRTELDNDSKGWTTVILLAALSGEGKIPNFPLKATGLITFVNGPLTPSSHE